jgi:hypothetical protein
MYIITFMKTIHMYLQKGYNQISTKTKLIVQTGSNKKVVINLELAESILPKELINKLNHILIELNHIQEEGSK